MDVIRTGKMDADINIQIEDWSEDYPSVRRKNDMVVAFPIAKETLNSDYKKAGPKIGRSFRLEIVFEDADAALIAYQQLLVGARELTDFKDKFSRKEFIKCL